MNSDKSRFLVVDALRGFAIVSIMLLHNIEHFDFYFAPENLPSWIVPIDKAIWDTLFFLFGGKSYAIFALLFGLTFFIQNRNQEKLGKDFRPRFAWRLLLLLAFGIINSAFYEGDILFIYAVIGFFLIPIAKFGNRALLWIALILMLQPIEWFRFFHAVANPGLEVSDPASWQYFGRMGEYITGGSFFETVKGNLTNGKKAVLLWTWENGRVFQTMSLFIFGILAGRLRYFETSLENKKQWLKVLLVSAIVFVPLFIFKKNISGMTSSLALARPLETIFSSWSNMAFMLVLVSGFVLLFEQVKFFRILNVLSPIGRMSLSNYILQSIVGSFIYYGFGLGLYKYTGATYSVLIGVVLAVAQGLFSTFWMSRHTRGPLETIWHKVTWLGKR